MKLKHLILVIALTLLNAINAHCVDGTLLWSYSTGGSIASSPALAADGTIYVGSSDGNLYALNTNGTVRWQYPTGGEVRSSPSVAPDGTIYVGSFDQMLHAVNPDG